MKLMKPALSGVLFLVASQVADYAGKQEDILVKGICYAVAAGLYIGTFYALQAGIIVGRVRG